MKKIFLFFGLFIAVTVLMTSCTKDEDKNEFTEITDVRGAVINITDFEGFYDLVNPDATVSFTVGSFGENVSSVKVWKNFNGGAPVEQETVSSFPTSLSYSLTDALVGLGVNAADLVPGDVIGYTFSDVSTSSGVYPSGKSVDVEVKCTSELDGTFDAETVATGGWGCTDTWTGTVRWENTGGGSYAVYAQDADHDEVLDFSMGSYWVCYGATATLPSDDSEGDLAINDVCSKLSFTSVQAAGMSFTSSRTLA